MRLYVVQSPELEARMEKLRLKFAEDEYQKMTKNVSSQVRARYSHSNIIMI